MGWFLLVHSRAAAVGARSPGAAVMDTCPKAALAEASRLRTSEARFNSIQTTPVPKAAWKLRYLQFSFFRQPGNSKQGADTIISAPEG